MYQTVPRIGVFAGIAALVSLASGGNAVSPEAEVLRAHAATALSDLEHSQALFGAKADAICQLIALAAEEPAVDPISFSLAKRFIRALPDTVPLPELSIDPDGSISLDWIVSRNRMFSLSVGANSRLAYAWLDGTDKGHAVARFDGLQVPERVLEGITSIATK